MADENRTEIVSTRIQEIKQQLKKYLERRIELSFMESGEQLAHFLANVTHQIAGLVILLCGVMFVLIGCAVFVGNIIQSISLGFLLVSLPLLIVGFLFLNMKPKFVTNRARRLFLGEVINILDMTKKEQAPVENRNPEPEYPLTKEQ